MYAAHHEQVGDGGRRDDLTHTRSGGMGKHEGQPKDKPYEPDPSRADDKDKQGSGKGSRGK
ncbi:hypothetical protein DPM19_13355 [Actinomadura craniellae]|uniref:Uncharacterized protein n=1 Tax=Actinomadura craniellae TaxID=2231787 RepID=A0A365H6T8_9ACTN|nr:hypothetical protein [Actinomadura craniellae]RAY14728.1 hypothetical protein DPM19_13355 [Actinomadura craniellae]